MQIGKWRTSWRERISYGLSDAADNLVFQLMTTYLLFYYTDVFGLKAADVALMFIVARVADTLESPLVGIMIDKTHSRFGKSRPFFLWFSLPYVILAVLTFIVPAGNYDVKLLWAYVTYLGLGFFYSTVNLPVTSVLPTLSDNPKELTLLGVIRQFFGSSVQIVVAVFTLPLVSLFGGSNQQKGFMLTVVSFGAISLFLILNTFFQIRERFTQPEIAHEPMRAIFKAARKNKPWLVLTAVIILYWLVTAIKNQTTIYYFKYVLNNENLVAWANSFTFTSLIGVLLIIGLSSQRGHKKTMQIGLVLAIVGQAILALGVALNQLWLLFTAIAINGIGQGMVVGLISIMIADTIRYGTTFGVQAEGVFSSASDLGVNLGLGLGGMITAGLLDLSGYVANKSQSPATLSMINLNYVWIPLALYVAMLILLHFYNERAIDKALEGNDVK